MRPSEIEKLLEAKDSECLDKLYSEVATSYDKVAMAAVVQAISIRQMRKLDKAATKLTWVGIGVAIVGVILAAIQLVLAFLHK
jgi:ABC-type glucose/galactose transport system permease subunit